jgi:hypothetical protein
LAAPRSTSETTLRTEALYYTLDPAVEEPLRSQTAEVAAGGERDDGWDSRSGRE